MAALAKPEAGGERKPLTVRTVNKYVRLNALINKLEKQRDQMRVELIDRFKGGERCPAEGPFILAVVTQERCANGWKEIAGAIVTGIRDPEEKDRAMQTQVTMLAVKKPTDTLTVKPNPDWK